MVGNELLTITFDRFSIASYQLFLRIKRLPEYTISFDDAQETYTITAPARFAAMLGVERPASGCDELPLADFLFDDQRAIVRQAIDAKRFAVWADCGLGKTPIALEFARHVMHRTGGRVLIFTLNEIVPQFIDECRKFYGDSLPMLRLTSREHMKEWAAGRTDTGFTLAIVNYEKLNHKGDADQVVNELRQLAGVIADESSRLKTGGGKQKWAMIKSCRGIEYKLSCTATPAPNEIMEFASQASFLEKMRSDNEIIWTYFRRDEKTHRWTVKKHARKAFFEFMAGWSIYVRDPRKYGWRKSMEPVPLPEIIEHKIAITPAQREAAMGHQSDEQGNATLINLNLTNTIQRNKLGQIARGFCYRKGEGGGYDRIESNKPTFIADLIRQEVASGLQVLVWTVFDAESEILAQQLGDGINVELPDFTAVHEDRLSQRDRFHAPVDCRHRAAIADWRSRQQCGDTQPAWNRWSEFAITLAGGQQVHIVYEPQGFGADMCHFEFHGPITSTGYRSHFMSGLDFNAGDLPDMTQWAMEFAQRVRDEAIKEQRKRLKLKKTQPDPEFPAAQRPSVQHAYDLLTGKTPKGKRLPILERFRQGESRVLISRAVMLGYGMNLQHCGSMIFSGFNDSYEQFYQALRRAYRYGQKRSLRVHVPYIAQLEGDTWENILRKQDQHERAIAEMEVNYIRAAEAITAGRPTHPHQREHVA